jgi:hypothetical protein
MLTARNFEVTSYRFNVVEIRSSEEYTHKCISNSIIMNSEILVMSTYIPSTWSKVGNNSSFQILYHESKVAFCAAWYVFGLILKYPSFQLLCYWTWGSGVIGPGIFNLYTRRRGAVSFTSQPLFPLRKRLRYPLDRRMGGSQEPVWNCWRREKSHNFPCWELNPGCTDRSSLVAILSELPRLLIISWAVVNTVMNHRFP